jgi:DNA-binding MarR family transcriptional regulator
MTADGQPALESDADVERHHRAQRAVILLAAAGRRLSAAIADRTGSPALAANVAALILCELSLRGPQRPRDLVDATGLTSGGMTKQLDHLEALGLVERTFGTIRRDRRASIVSLTLDGHGTAAAIAEAVDSQLHVVSSLVAELSALLDEERSQSPTAE